MERGISPDEASPRSHDDLMATLRLIVRDELNAFGSRTFGGTPRATGTSGTGVGGGVRRMVTDCQSLRSGRAGGGSAIERDPAHPAHAWVGRSIRSYAAAAELTGKDDDMLFKGFPSMWSGDSELKLLPAVIPKASGPFSRERRSEAFSDPGPTVGSSGAGGEYSRRISHTDASLPRVVRIASGGEYSHRMCHTDASLPRVVRIASGGEMSLRMCHTEASVSAMPSRDVSRSASVNSNISRASPVVPTSQPSTAAAVGTALKGLLNDPRGAPTERGCSPSEHRIFPNENRALQSVQITVDAPPGIVPLVEDVHASHDEVMQSDAQLQSPRTSHNMSTIYSVASSQWKSHGGSDHRGWSLLRTRAFVLVRNLYFENLTMLFIFANACTIGVQTENRAVNLTDRNDACNVVDRIISTFFYIELALRLFVYRAQFFTGASWGWNMLDIIVVGFHLVDDAMDVLNLANSNIPRAVTLVRMARILRLVRIIRIVRLLRFMSEFRTIVVSMSSSLRPLLSTIVFLALVVYVVGIFLTQLVTDYRIDHAGSPAAEELDAFFGSIGITAISLFQTVTGGLEWRLMVNPLMNHISPALGFVFVLYIMFTAMALMNIVTGVFVETALQRGRDDKDVCMINNLRHVFGVLDVKKSGMISWVDLQEHLYDPKLMTLFKDIDIDVTEARGLFQLLDRDGSGVIDADEFMSGALRLRGPAKSVDLQLVLRELADQRRTMQSLLSACAREDSMSELS